MSPSGMGGGPLNWDILSIMGPTIEKGMLTMSLATSVQKNCEHKQESGKQCQVNKCRNNFYTDSTFTLNRSTHISSLISDEIRTISSETSEEYL